MSNYQKLQILYDSIKNKNDFLANADNTLDNKAGTLMAFEITLGIGYLSLVLFNLVGIKFAEGVIGLVSLTISALLLLMINWSKDYVSISVDIDQHKDYLTKNEDELIAQLVSDAQNAFTKNNKKMKIKARLYKWAIVLLILSSLLLALSKIGLFYV